MKCYSWELCLWEGNLLKLCLDRRWEDVIAEKTSDLTSFVSHEKTEKSYIYTDFWSSNVLNWHFLWVGIYLHVSCMWCDSCVCVCVYYTVHVCGYLLSRLDWWQRDSLGVDDRQDLIADHRGDDLALGVGQKLGCNWLDLQRWVYAPWLARGPPRVGHKWDRSNYLRRRGERRREEIRWVVPVSYSTRISVGGWTPLEHIVRVIYWTEVWSDVHVLYEIPQQVKHKVLCTSIQVYQWAPKPLEWQYQAQAQSTWWLSKCMRERTGRFSDHLSQRSFL